MLTKATAPENPKTEEETEESPGLSESFLGGSLGWLISTFAHVAGLVTLAVVFIPLELPRRGDATVVASVSPIEEEYVLDLSEESGSIGEAVVPSESSMTLEASELAIEDNPLTPELGVLTSMQSMASSPLDALRAVGEGSGGNSSGLGKGMTSFFGVKTSGKRFVYVVDNSNSMGKGRLEAAIQEVQDSIDNLSPEQYFYVIFYSDTAYPLFYPKIAKTYVNATPGNKLKLREWLATIQHCLHTRGEEAMTLAMKLKPDVIYLLGDGAFTDRTVSQTLDVDDSRVLIHTFGFDMEKEKDRVGFESIAKKFRGAFHDVKVAPEMLIVERTNKRPRNNQRNGHWGIALTDSDSKKK
jgi:hypothetical protein